MNAVHIAWLALGVVGWVWIVRDRRRFFERSKSPAFLIGAAGVTLIRGVSTAEVLTLAVLVWWVLHQVVTREAGVVHREQSPVLVGGVLYVGPETWSQIKANTVYEPPPIYGVDAVLARLTGMPVIQTDLLKPRSGWEHDEMVRRAKEVVQRRIRESVVLDEYVEPDLGITAMDW